MSSVETAIKNGSKYLVVSGNRVWLASDATEFNPTTSAMLPMTVFNLEHAWRVYRMAAGDIEFLTADQVAAAAGISIDTLNRLVRKNVVALKSRNGRGRGERRFTVQT